MATRPKLSLSQLASADAMRDGKRFRIELSGRRLIGCCVVFFVFMSWMFIFGLLVGKGLPLVSSEDFSLQAGFLRFLGLGKEPPPKPPENVAQTWQDPKKMMESLTYYQELAQKGPPGPTQKDPAAEAAAKQPKTTIPPAPVTTTLPERPAPVEPEKIAQPKPAPPPAPPQPSPSPENVEIQGEHFTLLIASLKDMDNAQRLMEQLKAKGYAPRLHSLDLNGGGKWNRVLIGAFQSRESALKFAAEFNKKEKMEGLVIRESN